MTKNILEWGWHTSTPNSSSSSNTEWKPATTLLGGADPHATPAEPDQKVAAGVIESAKVRAAKAVHAEKQECT